MVQCSKSCKCVLHDAITTHTHDSTLPMNTRTHLSVLLHFNWLWCDTRLIIAANGPTQQPLGHQRLSWRAPREPHALLHAMALINRARGLYNGPVHSWMSEEEGCYIHTVRLHLSSAVVLLKRPQGTSPVLPGLVTASGYSGPGTGVSGSSTASASRRSPVWGEMSSAEDPLNETKKRRLSETDGCC